MDDGSYNVCLTVIDNFGSTDTVCHTVTVSDLGPIAAFSWNPEPQDEGLPVGFTDMSSSYPDSIISWIWDFDGLGTSTGQNPSFTFLDDGSYEVCLTVTDDDGSTNNLVHIVTVSNVAPVIDGLSGPIEPVQVDTSISLAGSFSDQGVLDTHTATIDWGSNIEGPIEISSPFDLLHTYTEAGIYTITLTIEDDDGESDIKTLDQYIVVYDPNGGFITGGGWINSPPGAYTQEPELTGRANFGFVSKYKKGRTSPTGNTEFQFKAGNLNFHSYNYEWLVITGSKAMFKGEGTINGAGNYGFKIYAIDEKLTQSTNDDLFRIKIWDKNNDDAVIYDNHIEDDESSTPTTVLSGGQIVIHKK